MKITSDPMMGKAAQASQYHDLFSRLKPEANCIVFDDMKEMRKVAQSLEDWSAKHAHPNAKVKTTRRYPTDGKPRCWLIWPAEALPVKTVIKGNWPRKA